MLILNNKLETYKQDTKKIEENIRKLSDKIIINNRYQNTKNNL